MSCFRITFWILGVQLYYGRAQFSDNTPPTVVLERHWMVPDTEPIGSVVVKVNAQDAEGDPLEFGLEKPDGTSNFNLYFNSSSRDLPFRIDSHGVVYTNDSLADRGGEKLFLYVTVFDGKLTHKSEVYVNILNSKNPQDPNQSQSPRIPSNVGLNYPVPNRPPPPPLGGSFPPLPGFPFPNFPNPNPSNPVLTTNRTLLRTKATPATTSTTSSPSTTSIPTTQAPTSTTSEKTSRFEEPRKTAEVTPTPVDGRDPDLIKNLALTIVPLVVVCTAFLVSAISACIFRKRICKARKKSKKGDKDKELSAAANRTEEPMAMTHWMGPRAYGNRYEAWETTDTNQPNVQPTIPIKLDPWEYPRHHLKVFSILGEGCFGQVWKCEALAIGGREGPSTVAVKTLKENAGERERLDLIQELQVMKSLAPHPNVVRLLGCCTEKDPLFVIMEYIPLGKLQSFLRDSRAQRNYDNMHARSATLTSRDLTSFCYQVARGMEFLSGKGIIHRDLAARNVLVGENQICKVADFGFARDVVTSHVYERKSEGRLPIRWMAPESLYDNLFSVKSDIWSFGVLIWEIVTLGSTPYPGIGAAEVMRKVRDGYRLDKPEHCRRELYNIMYYCWDQDPAERPTFTELVTLLEQLLLTETDYIQLDQFPDHSYYNMVSLSGEKL